MARNALKTRTMIDVTTATDFWADLNRTNSEPRYCALDRLPAAIVAAIMDSANLEVECSSYTVGEHSAFLRGLVTIDGVEFDYEVSLGSMHDESMYDDAGDFTGDDEDAHYAAVANELLECSEVGGLTVYFTEA